MKIRAFIRKFLFSPKWRCVACGREVFDDGYFCEKCLKKLPLISGYICAHCGRISPMPTEYCDSCKNRITHLDKGRSVFDYRPPISRLIQRFKYDGQRYLVDMFADYLSKAYFKNYFAADFICYVPMTAKSERKRGYNHGKLLSEKVGVLTGVPVIHCIAKVKETKRQARLTRTERIHNLDGAFRIVDKKAVVGKKALLIDDVTTTGATAEAICSALKGAGVAQVYMLTVASVSITENYGKGVEKTARKLFDK